LNSTAMDKSLIMREKRRLRFMLNSEKRLSCVLLATSSSIRVSFIGKTQL
jgi:hypothetical protein